LVVPPAGWAADMMMVAWVPPFSLNTTLLLLMLYLRPQAVGVHLLGVGAASDIAGVCRHTRWNTL
jgi:hypothetical protein